MSVLFKSIYIFTQSTRSLRSAAPSVPIVPSLWLCIDQSEQECWEKLTNEASPCISGLKEGRGAPQMLRRTGTETVFLEDFKIWKIYRVVLTVFLKYGKLVKPSVTDFLEFDKFKVQSSRILCFLYTTLFVKPVKYLLDPPKFPFSIHQVTSSSILKGYFEQNRGKLIPENAEQYVSKWKRQKYIVLLLIFILDALTLPLYYTVHTFITYKLI